MKTRHAHKRFSGEYIGFIRKKPFFIGTAVTVCAALYFGLPLFFRSTYQHEFTAVVETIAQAVILTELPVTHLPTPEPLKAIYMTSCAVGTPAFRAELVALVDETELNALVIDIKDYSGELSFIPKDETLRDFVSKRCAAPDMKEFLRALHEKDIYAIGRITVFQDPVLTKRRPDLAVKRGSDGATWKDYKGLSFTDPGAKEVWDYHIAIAKEAYAIGFDELNFDYIRFPSDGPMADIAFPWSGNRKKAEALEDFFAYLSEQLKSTGAVISADLFGMTTTNADDLNIGQIIEKVEPYFDYIAPMVYPSHYPPRFNGWANPNQHPYDVVKFSMDEAVKRFLATTTKVALRGTEPLATTTRPFFYPKKVLDKMKLRPWLQDFDYGGNYDIAEVRAQIQAVYDAGLTSWMLWSPSNRYTKDALLPATVGKKP
ncbi:MAG: putative glycoside hydrolase [Patescibacteria group bacterium]